VVAENQRVLDACDALERGDLTAMARGCTRRTTVSRRLRGQLRELDVLSRRAPDTGVLGAG